MSDFKLANLDPTIMKEVQELEVDLGVNLVAYQVEDNSYADMPPEKLKRIKELENKHGIILLAYPKSKAA